MDWEIDFARQKAAGPVVSLVGPAGPAAFVAAFVVNGAVVDDGASDWPLNASSYLLVHVVVGAETETRPRFVALIELAAALHSSLWSATEPQNGCVEVMRSMSLLVQQI